MRTTLFFVVMTACLATPAWSQPVAAATVPALTDEQVLAAFRDDLQAVRADILAKNISLTAEQAATFWPLFRKFQAEQDVIIDEQLRGMHRYAESYENLSDADALELMKMQLGRDARMNALREKWLGEFQKVLPMKQAVRVIQIDRRLANAAQVQMSARLPLVR